MATMTISVSDAMKEWIEAEIKRGDYASASDYLRDLVRRDRERRDHPQLTLDDLRRRIDESRASGVSGEKVADIFDEARRIAAAKGRLRA